MKTHAGKIDKTKAADEILNRTVAVCLCGMPGIGKKTLVRMLLDKHPEVNPVICSVEDLKSVNQKENEEEKVTWYLIRPFQERSYPEFSEVLWEFFRNMNKGDKLIFSTNGKIPEELLEFIWNGSVEILYPEALRFTRSETYQYIKGQKSALDCEQAYRLTRGWAGCLALMVRIQKQLPESWLSEELWSRYEIRRYVQKNIVEQLSEAERKLLFERAALPRLEEELVSQLWDDPQKETEEGLFQRGIMIYVPKKKYWFIQPVIRRMLEYEINPQRCETAIRWYEEKGYVSEAVECSYNLKEQGVYRDCLIRNYDKVSFLTFSLDLKRIDIDCPELLFIRGMEVFFRQDRRKIDSMYHDIRMAWENVWKYQEDQRKWKEIFLNIAYVNSAISLHDWMMLLETLSEPGEKMHLYYILGESFSWLSGIRDLTELFSGTQEQNKRYQMLWKDRLSEKEWIGYQLAGMEYAFQTDQLEKQPERLFDLITLDSIWQHRMGVLFLLYLFVEGTDGKELVDNKMQILVRSLQGEESEICRYNATALYYLAEAKWGEKEDIIRWLRATGGDIANKAGRTKLHYMAAIKLHIYLGNYNLADQALEEFLPYVEKNRIWKYWAEGLFLKAIVEKELGRTTEAVRLVAQSLSVAERFRYVRIYTGYGKKGYELLTLYKEWMCRNHIALQNRKKRYYYRNVNTMPYIDWVDYIIRKSRQIKKVYAEQTKEDQVENLTVTERMVIQYLNRGYSNSEICKEMNIKLTTVKSHIYSIYRKLDVSTRTQAIQKARQLNIL